MRMFVLSSLALFIAATPVLAETSSQLPQERMEAIAGVCRDYTTKSFYLKPGALKANPLFRYIPGVVLVWNDCLRSEMTLITAPTHG